MPETITFRPDEDAVRAVARKEAIDEARAKAKILARDLGVRLVRVVNFSENSGGYPIPYYSRDAAMGGALEAKAAPETSVTNKEKTRMSEFFFII